ncbi:hypothetical protein F5I97DRAFT_1939301 [Phlebopus sp. FC_14]|nr:hypothetical protein F5I97DRAFT_1939301 [Phlebopus sp. FC_14]
MSAAVDGVKAAKKRKLTDKSIPNALSQVPEFAQESKMYQSLLEMERKLDWTMMRKRVEVQDALARNPTTPRTLRVFLSHSVSGQPWQVGETDGEGEVVNFETGQGIPAWSFKVEGRLLEPPNQRSRDRVAPRKFSTFIKRMVVELDRDPNLYPDGNIVEWPRPQGVQPPLDGFTVRRTGDQPTRIRIIMYLEQTPEQYKVGPELADVLAIKEESRIGVIQALWNYIKINGLQDKVDRRKVKADDYLRPIFGTEVVLFQQLPELVNRHLMPPDPVVLHYTLNPAVPSPERPAAWDIEIKMEDTALKSRMAVTVQTSKESMQDLSKLDDEIALLAQSLHNSHTKRVFLQSFADDPAKFIQTWLESQSRDLESILGSGPSEGATIRAEELRRSDFFRLPWVEEALGKFKQWAGEKISSRDKTIVVDELKELEQDIELRKQGISRYVAAEDYHHVLSKKKESLASGEAEKLLPLDALGIVMVTHGEEFGNDSAFGTSLVKLGRAHCKIATLQEAYALTFRDTFISSCERFAQDIKDYEHQRKKLESRRLSYDAAISKLEKIKTSKKEKEKERREVEDELQRCRLRFEETSEDVRSRIQAIQENEIQQHRELTTFLDIQLNFSKQYFDVLQDRCYVSKTFCRSILPKFEHVKHKSRMHVSSRSANMSPSLHQKRSNLSNHSTVPASSNTSEEDEVMRTPSRRKSDAENKPMSRPNSRASRKRSDSNGAMATPAESVKSIKKMSVTGWASSAVSSIAGRGKKDRDYFSALMNDDEGEKDDILDVSRPPSLRSLSRKSPKAKAQDLEDGSSPRTIGRILIPPSLQERKIVRALHDFNGSSDDLTFKAGDEVVVVSEVLDDWWLGMLKDGQKGLFPRVYTKPIANNRMSFRASPNGYDLSGRNHAQVFQDETDDDESIDHYLPMDVPHSATAYGFDMQSLTTTAAEDEEKHLVPVKQDDEGLLQAPEYSPTILPPSLKSKRTSSEGLPAKRAPPPAPPPRRSTNSRLPPVVPDRPPSKHSSPAPVSVSAPTPVYLAPPSSVASAQDQDVSPFDSLMDVSLQCTDFKQHPRERTGLCGNCFRMH